MNAEQRTEINGYEVILHPAEEGGYWTSVTNLPGAGSQGESVEEAIAMTRKSLELILEAQAEDASK